MSNDNDHNHKHGVRGYIIVALILAVITYLEYYIVEFPIAWLGTGGTLFWVVAMSIIKFVMVVAFFMHLKDDDATYSGFFTSGMVIGMGTFIAFTFLMTLPGSLALVRAEPVVAAHGEASHGYGDEDHLDEETVANIESDGYSRDTQAILLDPPPKDQSLVINPPAAASDGWTVSTPSAGLAESQAEAPATPAPAAPAPAAQAATVSFDAVAAEAAYNANCASCHQASGAGLPGAFPPLANHMPDFATSDEAREYVIKAVVYGLQGAITVNGMTYSGVMPPWGYLPDDVLAGALNHAYTAWDNSAALPEDWQPVTAEEVAALKGLGLAPAQVISLRNALDLP